MRKIREVLRLHFEARLSERQISNICVLGKGTVRRFLKRAEAVELSWPLPPTLDDAALEKRLFPPPPPPSAGQRPQPDYATIHKELRGANVTLQLLWEEYKQEHSTGYSYSRYVAAVFMLRSESSRWVGALSAALCSNITGRPPALQAFQEGHQRRQIGASRRSLRQALDVDAC